MSKPNEISNNNNDKTAWACQQFAFSVSLGQVYHQQRYVHLSPKVSAVLEHLCQNAPDVTNKFEVLDQVWPNQQISDAVVTDAIRVIRAALKEKNRGETLATVPKQGYRIVHQLKPISTAEFESLNNTPTTEANKTKRKKILLGTTVFLFVAAMVYMYLFPPQEQQSKAAANIIGQAYSQFIDSSKSNHDFTIEQLEKSLELNESDPKLLNLLAEAYSKKAQYDYQRKRHWRDKTLEVAEQLFSIAPDSEQSWSTLAVAQRTNGHFEQSRSTSLDALEKFPNSTHAKTNLAWIAYKKGALARALNDQVNMFDESKHLPRTYFGIADTYRLLQLNDVANSWYEKGITLNPDDVLVAHNYFLNLLALKQYEKVATVLEQEKIKNKDYRQKHVQLLTLITLIHQDNYAEAIAYFDTFQLPEKEGDYVFQQMTLLMLPLIKSGHNNYQRIKQAISTMQANWLVEINHQDEYNKIYFNLATLLAGLDQQEAALMRLNEAIDMGFRDIERIHFLPAFDTLRHSHEFLRLIEKLQLIIHQQRQATMGINNYGFE